MATEVVTIRRMTAADLPAVLAIEAESFTMPWSEATYEGLLRRSDADLFLAEGEGEVLGYAALWAVLDQGELGNLAVAPARRGRGVGTRLLRTVFQYARERGVRELYLEVRVSNTAAQRLYARHGFEVVGRRRGYYAEPPEDALVLRRLLPRQRPIPSEPEGADDDAAVS
jgi:[ribosomal protein S18]-alanine N-acetyltransferase